MGRSNKSFRERKPLAITRSSPAAVFFNYFINLEILGTRCSVRSRLSAVDLLEQR